MEGFWMGITEVWGVFNLFFSHGSTEIKEVFDGRVWMGITEVWEVFN